MTVSAVGYNDAEAFTPKVTDLRNMEGIVVKLWKIQESGKPKAPKQWITGVVTRKGRPLITGWVGLWGLRRLPNSVNASILRGRTIAESPVVSASAPIKDGIYALEVPYQHDSWYLVAEEPGIPPTQIGPVSIGLNEQKKLDISCVEGGRVSGRIKQVPEGWEGMLWVVAFNNTGIREETRVDRHGEFSILLPPGEYGLKVGHDAYHDSEVPRGFKIPKEAWEKSSDPWARARMARVEPGRNCADLELELPPGLDD